MAKPRKKTTVLLVGVGLKIKKPLWLKWKMKAAQKATTMTEYLEEALADYMEKN